MGIQGLLPLLDNIQRATHLRDCAGKTLGVDAYGWLHRGVFACAIELADGTPTRKHIDFVLRRVRMLIHFGVKPYMVFDGARLPSKAHIERERSARRKECRRVGLELLRTGRRVQAYQELQKAVDVTPSMAREVIEELKALGVPYVVAPYEADSQLAYLEKKGIISGVISEDSDLLVFGVQHLYTKLDQYGECILLKSAEFTSCSEVSLADWTLADIRQMAILSGCDYLPGIPTLGIKTAHRLIRKHKTIENTVRNLLMEGKKKVPPGYLEAFYRAEKTFLYPWVYCPAARAMVHLTPLPEGLLATDMPFIGQHAESDIAAGVAAGDLDPNTKLSIPVRVSVPVSAPNSRISKTANPSWKANLAKPVVATPEAKPGKPITDFFRAQRTPLAELDPNSFAQSPSQQRLLHSQSGTSWAASQAPARRASSGLPLQSAITPLGHSSIPRRSTTDPLIARKLSPKRQRLCSVDSLLSEGSPGALGEHAATSRFFSKPGTQQSPLMRKALSKSKHNDFVIWADQLPSHSGTMSTTLADARYDLDASSQPKRKKLAIFNDESQSQSCEETQETVTTQPSTSTKSTGTVDTPATSFRCSQSQTLAPVGSSVEDVCQDAQASKTVHAVSASDAAISESPLQKKKSQPHPEKAASAIFERDDVVVPASSPFRPSDKPKFSNRIDEEDLCIKDEWLSMENQLVRHGYPGSEDMIIPASPDSSNAGSSNRPVFDVAKFAYTA